MARNIAKNAVERTSAALLDKVFPDLGKVAGGAARAVFSAVVRTGSALVTDLAAAMDGDATSRKGRQEKVSGWLARYDFASPVHGHLWSEGVALVGRDTVIEVDSGDVSKEFGGAGMEGMEMGYDASRGVVAMGHSLLCAAVVWREEVDEVAGRGETVRPCGRPILQEACKVRGLTSGLERVAGAFAHQLRVGLRQRFRAVRELCRIYAKQESSPDAGL